MLEQYRPVIATSLSLPLPSLVTPYASNRMRRSAMRFSEKQLETFLDHVRCGRMNTFFSELCAVQMLKEKFK